MRYSIAFTPALRGLYKCHHAPPIPRSLLFFFIIVFSVSLSLLTYDYFVVRRRSSLVTDALAVTARGSLVSVLAPHHPCAHISHAKDRRIRE